MNKIIIESCCASVDDVIESEKAGMDRVEMNSAMALGGLTPTIGMIKEIKAKTTIPVMAMIRPRTGGFCYTDTEFDSMIEDARAITAAGAEGIVFGILKENREIDFDRTKVLADAVRDEAKKTGAGRDVELVFHRAIDIVPNWKDALDGLISLGFNRVLTSGQKPKAIEGIETIKEMISYADGRIEILPGSGIRKENILEVIEKSGTNQVHLSKTKTIPDYSMRSDDPDEISVTFNGRTTSENSFEMTDRNYFSEIRSLVDAQ